MLALGATVIATTATGANLNQLQSELGANNAKQQSLSDSVSGLDHEVSTLNSQIALVQSRAAAVQAAVNEDEAADATAKAAVARERKLLATLQARLKRADTALASELITTYEQPQQSLVSVVVEAKGFQQMLDQLQYMDRANHEEQSIIRITKQAKAQATAAEQRLTTLERADAQATQQRLTEARALSGMQALLNSRRQALSHAEAARAAALAATRAHGAQLESEINTIKQQQAAAARAAEQAEQAAQAQQSQSTSEAPVTATPSGGWAIPEAIVMCESGGQNLPPNSAGASGYYQIIPSTWKDFGGTGAQAYQASLAEQSAVASRIWDGGAGASNWVCAGIVGIT